MTTALHRRWTAAARQVFVNEALDDFIGEVSDANVAAARPVREVRDAVHVHPHCAGRVVPVDKSTHVGRYERREIAIAQPCRRYRMNGLERIHGGLLKWGCHHRRCLLLCEVQTASEPPQALTRFAVRQAVDDEFA